MWKLWQNPLTIDDGFDVFCEQIHRTLRANHLFWKNIVLRNFLFVASIFKLQLCNLSCIVIFVRVGCFFKLVNITVLKTEPEQFYELAVLNFYSTLIGQLQHSVMYFIYFDKYKYGSFCVFNWTVTKKQTVNHHD